MMAGSTGDDARAEMPEGDEELLGLFQQLIHKRQEGMRAKQAAAVAETEARLRAAADALLKTLTRDAQTAGAAAVASVGKVEAQLQSAVAAMEAATVKYQAEMKAIWDRYSEAYNSLGAVKQEAKTGMERRKAGAKRKLEALSADSQRSITQLDTQLQQLQAQTQSKLPQLAKVLKQVCAEEDDEGSA